MNFSTVLKRVGNNRKLFLLFLANHYHSESPSSIHHAGINFAKMRIARDKKK